MKSCDVCGKHGHMRTVHHMAVCKRCRETIPSYTRFVMFKPNDRAGKLLNIHIAREALLREEIRLRDMRHTGSDHERETTVQEVPDSKGPVRR